MPGLDDYSASSGEYFRQSGAFINYRIQQLYDDACHKIATTYMGSHQGIAGKQIENTYRYGAMLAFQIIFTESINLPNVESKLMAVPEDERRFKDKWDLQDKIACACSKKTSSKDVMRWWIIYSKILVDAGLIKLFTGDDSPFNKFRR